MKTPGNILRHVERTVREELVRPEVRGKLENLGSVVVASPSGDLRDHLNSELVKWGRLIKDANITAG